MKLIRPGPLSAMFGLRAGEVSLHVSRAEQAGEVRIIAELGDHAHEEVPRVAGHGLAVIVRRRGERASAGPAEALRHHWARRRLAAHRRPIGPHPGTYVSARRPSREPGSAPPGPRPPRPR